MRFARTTMAAALAMAACSTPAPAEPKPFDFGAAFSLKVGEQAHSADKRIQVGFDSVPSDSRCPKGEQCVWQGDAVVRVWIQQGAGPRQTRDLHSSVGAAQSAAVLGQELRLVRLDPAAVSGRAIQKGDYVATLLVGQGPAAEAQR